MAAQRKIRELVVPANETALNEAIADHQIEVDKIISVMLQPGQSMAIGDYGLKYRLVYRL